FAVERYSRLTGRRTTRRRPAGNAALVGGSSGRAGAAPGAPARRRSGGPRWGLGSLLALAALDQELTPFDGSLGVDQQVFHEQGFPEVSVRAELQARGMD